MQPQPLTPAGRAYVVATVLFTAFVLALIVVAVSGTWRAPLFAWPPLLLAYLRTEFAEVPKVVLGGAGVAAVVILIVARAAVGRMRKKAPPQPTVGSGLVMFARDVTVGIVALILEAISD